MHVFLAVGCGHICSFTTLAAGYSIMALSGFSAGSFLKGDSFGYQTLSCTTF